MENNNVSYELLAMSNSDSSEQPRSFSVTRKKKLKRKSKPPRNVTLSTPSHKLCTSSCLVTVSLVFTVIFCWLLTLTWVAVALHTQTTHLGSTIQGVAAGSQGVPDALQKCHSLSRELQNNQTKLFTQLAVLSQHLSNFTTQISFIQGGLTSVEEKLMASPELVNVPHDLQALSGSVASFGSQIQDLQTTSNTLKDEHATLLETLKALKLNISVLNKAVAEFSKQPISINESNSRTALEEEKKLESIVNALKSNVSSINETLSHSLQWVQEDQRRDNKRIEELRELGANASSQISTIHNALSGQEKKFKDIEDHFSNLTIEVDHFKTQTNIQFGNVSERFKKLENTSSHVSEELMYMKTLLHDPGEQNITSTIPHHINDSNSTSGSEHHAIAAGENMNTN